MIEFPVLIKGMLIGFSIAAPVGPIGVLCIRRTLTDGRLAGLVTGLGAATADAVYGMVAGFGLTLISTFLVSQQTWVRLLGGGFLCYLGVRTFVAQPIEHAERYDKNDLLGSYLSTFFLTLTNPLTILSFAAIFAGLGLGIERSSYLSAGLLVLGVFGGSAAWWLLLSMGVGLLRKRLNLRILRWVNRVSGSIILVFGIAALASLVNA